MAGFIQIQLDKNIMTSSSRKRASNIFDFLPQTIIAIISMAKENNGRMDEESIEEIKAYQTVLSALDAKKQSQYFRHALLLYREYFNSPFVNIYANLMSDFISKTTLSDDAIDKLLTQDKIATKKMCDKNEEIALKKFNASC